MMKIMFTVHKNFGNFIFTPTTIFFRINGLKSSQVYIIINLTVNYNKYLYFIFKINQISFVILKSIFGIFFSSEIKPV